MYELKETTYTYDSMGRIKSVSDGEHTITYTYDEYGQLIREDNQALDKTFQYEYNENGSIVSVTVNGAQKVFSYNGEHPDALTSYQHNSITYNAIGYPVTYGRKRFEWTQGKLTKYYDEVDPTGSLSSESTEFTYNAYGQRMTKKYVYDPGPDYSGDFSIGKDVSYNYNYSGRLIREF